MTEFSGVLHKSWPTRLTIMAIGLVFAATAALAEAPKDKPLSGTLEFEQISVAFIGSGQVGGGTLTYQGKTYEFSIGGLGIGGIGISKINATGEVYGLKRIEDFGGAYGASTGELWLENTKGVVLHLDAKRKGVALSLGVDGIVVDLK